MEFEEWKHEIISIAINQIKYKSNMSNSDINGLTLVLTDYLEQGLSVLRSWRKIKDNSEFLTRKYDSALINYLKNKESANGRELYNTYNVGGVSSAMKSTPEGVLKSEVPQRMV